MAELQPDRPDLASITCTLYRTIGHCQAGCATLVRAKRVKLLSHLDVQVNDVKVGHSAKFVYDASFGVGLVHCSD